MKKTIGIVLLILVFVIGSGLYVRSRQQVQQKNDSAMVKKSADNDMEQVTPITEKTMNNFRYQEFSSGLLEKVRDKKRVLFFYASWCPTCRPADANLLKNIDSIPEDTVVIRVNYNDSETDTEEKALAKTYGITYQHTYVQIDLQGKEVTKWNGGQFEELVSNIK